MTRHIHADVDWQGRVGGGGRVDEGARVDSGPGTNAVLRVLVHDVDRASQHRYGEIVLRGGFELHDCTGPGTAHCPVCPLLDGDRCPPVEEVDVMVFAYHATSATSRGMLAALRDRYPDTPVVVIGTGPSVEAHHDDLVACTVLRHPVTAEELWGAIRGAPVSGQPAERRV